MDNRNKVLIAAAFLGLVAGISASSALTDNTVSECEKTEDAIKQQANVSGPVACFPPGVLDVNQSEEVEEGSELECVCRRSYNGEVQIWSINKAS